MSIDRNDATAFVPADILLPAAGTDMQKWAVVACDQFTSEPEYWEEVDRISGDEPSTRRLILPESELGSDDVDAKIADINASMHRYLDEGVFEEIPGAMIYVERTQSDGKIRHGLVGAVDLDKYDYTPGSGTLIRATEGTVLSRIPPRMRVRKDAPIELPHVMLLIDDPDGTVIEPLTAACRGAAAESADRMRRVYDTDLMLDGGHVSGYLLTAAQQAAVAEALEKLASPEETEKKYALPGAAPLLFAVGDGNHSLATAKQCYEDQKKSVPESERDSLPSRFALAEVVNLHDEALQFEPIHRVVFGVDPAALIEAFLAFYPGAYVLEGPDAAQGSDSGVPAGAHVIRFVSEDGSGRLIVPAPKVQLAVGTLQAFLDVYLKEHGGEVDYIHGDDVTERLGSKHGSMGFLLPAMAKDELFRTVMADGVLPRKTFSMGHAQDKRYYLEARRIR